MGGDRAYLSQNVGLEDSTEIQIVNWISQVILSIWKDGEHWQVTFQVLLGLEMISFEYPSPLLLIHLEDASPPQAVA